MIMLRLFAALIFAMAVGCDAKAPAPVSWTSAIEPTTGQFRGTYYVGGNVKHPGAHSLPDRVLSLKQALIAAGAKPDKSR
jgi:hypothetical protein